MQAVVTSPLVLCSFFMELVIVPHGISCMSRGLFQCLLWYGTLHIPASSSWLRFHNWPRKLKAQLLWRMLSIPYIFFWHIPLSTRSRWVLPAFLFFCFRSPKPANAFPSPVCLAFMFFFTTAGVGSLVSPYAQCVSPFVVVVRTTRHTAGVHRSQKRHVVKCFPIWLCCF